MALLHAAFVSCWIRLSESMQVSRVEERMHDLVTVFVFFVCLVFQENFRFVIGLVRQFVAVAVRGFTSTAVE